jgi:hypothetical protein
VKLQHRLDEALAKLAENPRRMGAEKMAIGDRKEIYR